MANYRPKIDTWLVRTPTDDFGLLFYNARWYDPALGRFAQADSVIPDAGDPLAFDRYSYVRDNPMNMVDPSGHNWRCGSDGELCQDGTVYEPLSVDLSANILDENGNRVPRGRFDGSTYGQFGIDDDYIYPGKAGTTTNGICGVTAFAAIYRYRSGNRGITLNQMISYLEGLGNIFTNWSSAGDIANMAFAYGWEAKTSGSDGHQLCLSGSSQDRLDMLITWLEEGWSPIVLVRSYADGSLGGDISHWITIIDIVVLGNETRVWIYNPGCDCVRDYDWNVFYTYLSQPYLTDDSLYTLNSNTVVLIRPPRRLYTNPPKLGNNFSM